MKIKVTIYPHCAVVNTPGSHLQRQPRVYRGRGFLDRAEARERELYRELHQG
jgi:hypothetical protein